MQMPARPRTKQDCVVIVAGDKSLKIQETQSRTREFK
jgi:hypothetical protein